MKHILVALLILIAFSCSKTPSTPPPQPTVTYKIGDTLTGGTIFYVDSTLQHGLVCAPSDWGLDMQWWSLNTPDTLEVVGTDSAVGSGSKNTDLIIAAFGVGSYAAFRARYQVNFGGKTDWYLPSKGELDLMYQNRAILAFVDQLNPAYWSSTQVGGASAWTEMMVTADYYAQPSACRAGHKLRAIRSF